MIMLSIIDAEGRKQIFEASFRVLEETGVQVDHPGIFPWGGRLGHQLERGL